MQQELLDHLKKITEEEQKILEGSAEVDKELYTSGRDFIVDSRKMLDEGKLITVRTHTRFIHFPVHRHNSPGLQGKKQTAAAGVAVSKRDCREKEKEVNRKGIC